MRDIIEDMGRTFPIRTRKHTEHYSSVIEQLDLGKLRVQNLQLMAGKSEWVKSSGLVFSDSKNAHAGPMEFHDKMPLKKIFPQKEFVWYRMPLPVKEPIFLLE